jgi:hypothetical protein
MSLCSPEETPKEHIRDMKLNSLKPQKHFNLYEPNKKHRKLMKNAIVGFFIALIIMIICRCLNQWILAFKIPEFLIGWISCMGYNFYQKYSEIND